jgi:hypothetical protein
MKRHLNKLVFILIITSFFTGIGNELQIFKMNLTSVEHHQTDKCPYGEPDSPFCLDSSSADMINCYSPAEFLIPVRNSDKPFLQNVFHLRTYSKCIWQPPKIS